MRISLRHEIVCEFGKPVPAVLRMLRVTPWAIECQHLDAWRIDVNCDCRLWRGDDAFGNIVDTVSAEHIIDRLSIIAEGEVVTSDSAGIVHRALERFPPAFYLRETELTATDDSLREFAQKATSGSATTLDKLHALLVAVCDTIKVETSDKPASSATATFRDEKGTARDIAHMFIAAARHIDAPARFVSGCLVPEVDPETTDARHDWAEAFVPKIGWIGFDPVQGLCTHEGHVRIAFALDYLGAMPIRTAPAFGASETIKTKVIACETGTVKTRQERSFGMTQEQFQG